MHYPLKCGEEGFCAVQEHRICTRHTSSYLAVSGYTSTCSGAMRAKIKQSSAPSLPLQLSGLVIARNTARVTSNYQLLSGSRHTRPPVCLREVVLCGSRRTRQSTYRGTRPAGHNAASRAVKHLRVKPESNEPEQLVTRRFDVPAVPKHAHKRPSIDHVSAVEEREPSSSSWCLARQQRSVRQGCCGLLLPPILPTRASCARSPVEAPLVRQQDRARGSA